MRIIILFTLFVFSSCGIEEKTTGINFDAHVLKTVGNDKGLLDITYSAAPVGSFTINEIFISGHKIEISPKKAKGVVGFGGTVLSAESVSYKEQEFPFDKNARELTLKTKWQGQKNDELVRKYILPPDFELTAVSDKVSSITPLTMELKDDLVYSDWDSCGVIIRNNESDKIYEYDVEREYASIRADKNELKSKRIEIDHTTLQKHIKNKDGAAGLRGDFYVLLSCVKKYQSEERAFDQGPKRVLSSDKLIFQIISPKYRVRIE